MQIDEGKNKWQATNKHIHWNRPINDNRNINWVSWIKPKLITGEMQLTYDHVYLKISKHFDVAPHTFFHPLEMMNMTKFDESVMPMNVHLHIHFVFNAITSALCLIAHYPLLFPLAVWLLLFFSLNFFGHILYLSLFNNNNDTTAKYIDNEMTIWRCSVLIWNAVQHVYLQVDYYY